MIFLDDFLPLMNNLYFNCTKTRLGKRLFSSLPFFVLAHKLVRCETIHENYFLLLRRIAYFIRTTAAYAT